MRWTIAAIVGGAVGFWWLVPLANLYDSIQSLVVSASIMVAAIFVRLNRGMPTLDWKGIDPDQRSHLTSEILNVNKEYVAVISVHAVLLISLIILSGIGKLKFLTLFPICVHQAMSGYVGILIGFCITRMGYIVWRDYDIVRLQKKLIDDAGQKEIVEKAGSDATDKVAKMREANLRGPGVSRPSAWGE